MQLNAVVLPAPLGPISPTISHSLTVRLSPSMAVRPPKRMVRSRTSSTDITAPGQGRSCCVTVLVVQREAMTGEPLRERPQHLPETAGVEDDRLQQQPRADDVGDVGLVVGVEVRASRCDGRSPANSGSTSAKNAAAAMTPARLPRPPTTTITTKISALLKPAAAVKSLSENSCDQNANTPPRDRPSHRRARSRAACSRAR